MINDKLSMVTLSANDIAMTMSIIKVLQKVATDKNDKDEANLMQELFDSLVKYKRIDNDNVSVNLNFEQRFAIWLSLNTYKDFCIHSMDTDGIAQAERIMKSLQSHN